MDNVGEQVLVLLGEQAGINPKEISLDSKLEELNFDSVAVVELVFVLEETFNISIPFEGIDENELKRNFHSVSSLISHIKELLKTNV